jgi:hypothetical protein
MAEDKKHKRPERRHVTAEELGRKFKPDLKTFDNQHRDDGKPSPNNGQGTPRR